MSTLFNKRLLIIDDDRFFCKTVSQFLQSAEYEILSTHTLAEGKQLCHNQKVDVILLDQKLPDGDGVDLCQTILESSDHVKIIFITAFPNFDHAVKALRIGAFDYLSKPLDVEELERTIHQAFRILELEAVEQIQNYKDKQEVDRNVMVGKEEGLKSTYTFVQLAASNDIPVLITGETGTGKNVVAKAIHYNKNSRTGSFMGINCAALPENLIEAELFGYEKGAFTGAASTRKGIFELADGGTLFLDEIGDLPLHLQSKLLGVLDDQHIKRLGGQSYIAVSTRVIAATNVNLEEAVEQGKFRQDLYYRLRVLPIHIPPLRKRIEDIHALCEYFIKSSPLNQTVTLPIEEVELLKRYHWPGNVRELKNVLERALVFQRDNMIFPSELIATKPQSPFNAELSVDTPVPSLETVEKEHIVKVLQLLKNNNTHAARALGISRSTLLRKLKQYNIHSAVS